MKPFLALLAAAIFASGCFVKGQRSDFVIEKLVAPTAAAAGSPCTISPGTQELAFASFNPDVAPTSVSGFRYGVVVNNRLKSNADLNPTLRINTNDMIVKQAVMDYEVVQGGVTIPRLITAASGFVPVSSQAAVGVILMDPATAQQVPANQTVRVTVHLEGLLIDGSTVKTNEYEFLLTRCSTASCDATSACP